MDLPAVAVPFLADVDEGEIEKPQDGEEGCVSEAACYDAAADETDPGDGQQGGIGMCEPEERGQVEEGAGDADLAGDVFYKDIDGGETVFADEWDDLEDRGQEGYGVDDSEEAEDEEAGEPVGRARLHVPNLCKKEAFLRHGIVV